MLITLDEICKAASYVLKHGGTFAMVHRPDRLIDIIESFRKHGLEPKRLRMVHPKKNKEANHILIEARKGGQFGGLKILPPLIIHTEENKYTEEVLRIYNNEKEWKCMFLNLLTKKEKLKFIDLAIYMVDVDGEPNEVEKALLSRMYGDLGHEIVDEYTFGKSDSIDETIEYFMQSNQAVKNIIFLNLVWISMLEDMYNTSEHVFLEKVQKKFGITAQKRIDLMHIVYDERDLREKALRAIKN